MRTKRGLHQDTVECREVFAVVALIPHVDRIPLTSLDRSGDILPADGRLDDVLHSLDRQPVSRDRLSVDADVSEVALGHALREHTTGALDLL